jgi:hypothetical protein
MLFSNSAEITQCNQNAQDHRRGRTVFPGLSGFCGLYIITHTKTQEQDKEKIVLVWQEKETHGKESVCSKSKWSYRLQIQGQTNRKGIRL